VGGGGRMINDPILDTNFFTYYKRTQILQIEESRLQNNLELDLKKIVKVISNLTVILYQLNLTKLKQEFLISDFRRKKLK